MKKVLKDWSIKAPWGNIALTSWGNPHGEPVLMIHGRQDSNVTFIPLLEYLPDNYHYVAIDLPGNGKSDPFPIGLMVLRFLNVAAVDFTVQHLKWKQFICLAHSMGSEIALFYGTIYPKKITKYILLDPNPSVRILKDTDSAFYFKNYFAKYYSTYDKVNYDNREYTRNRAVEAVMKARGLTRDQAELVLSRNMKEIGPDNYKLSWDKRLKFPAPLNFTFDTYLELLSNNLKPTLTITASGSLGWVLFEELQKELQKKIKHYYVKVVDGNHDVHLTNPELMGEDVAWFLDTRFDSKAKL